MLGVRILTEDKKGNIDVIMCDNVSDICITPRTYNFYDVDNSQTHMVPASDVLSFRVVEVINEDEIRGRYNAMCNGELVSAIATERYKTVTED